MVAHAKLSASGASRWLSCPASVEMTKNAKNTSSFFAQEGTTAHELAEVCLKTGDPPERYLNGKLTETDISVDSDMIRYVSEYIDYINALSEANPNTVTMIEERVEFTNWVPAGFGTSDAIVVDGDTVHVVDLKYGKGLAVYADNNPQGMLYALGTHQSLSFLYDFKNIVIHIVQPRIGNYSQWECTVDELLAFGEYVKERAQLCELPDATFGPSEKACQWCAAASTCKALAEHNLEVIGAEFDNLDCIEPTDQKRLTNKDISKILPHLSLIDKWIIALKEHALETVLAGDSILGYKAVAGRSVRKWSDESTVINVLGDSAYTKKIISPTQAEKLDNEIYKTQLENNVIKPNGKPTLVPNSDKRLEISNVVDDFENV